MVVKCSRRAARRDVIASLPNSADRPAGGQRFPRDARLVRCVDFDVVYRTGKRLSSSHFTAFVRTNELPRSRFGFSIKKALGGAVVRNRMRRRLREIVRCRRQEIASGWDIVIHPKSAVATREFAMLAEELVRLLKKL